MQTPSSFRSVSSAVLAAACALFFGATGPIQANSPEVLNAASGFAELTPARIREIAAMLDDQPSGACKPLGDRAFWESPETRARFGSSVAKAEKIAATPLPKWNDDDYLDFSRTGQRPRGEAMMNARHGRILPLALAECLEAKGRFLPAIKEALEGYADEPTWTLPAHNSDIKHYRQPGCVWNVELANTGFARELAQTLYLLGDRVEPALKNQIAEMIQTRILDPFAQALKPGAANKLGWLGNREHPVQNNWNAVCLAGIAGAAEILVPSKEARAVYLAAAEHYSQYFLNSIDEDGFNTEGVGYWSYAFDNYAILREILVHTTHGKVDLFLTPKVRNAALFGIRMRIGVNGYPFFGDARCTTLPGFKLIGYYNTALRLGLDLPKYSPEDTYRADRLFPPTPVATGTAAVQPEDQLRSFYAKAGVYCGRPASGSPCQLGIGIKAGGNHDHSHNDVGSYDIVLGQTAVTGDPGGPFAYNRDTFGPKRYEFKTLNSYGHPVPVIAGHLQVDATKISPKVIDSRFTVDEDMVRIDLKPAYAVPDAREVERKMVYNRTGKGQITITDRFGFTAPKEIEEALITRGEWKQTGPKTIQLTSKDGERLEIEIQAPGDVKFSAESISEFPPTPAFTRIGIKFAAPIEKGEVTMVYRPI